MKPITYPARPINGGPLEKAHAKHGEWFYEPKYNGWRALVHVPTGTMFNRHGRRLSIQQEFAEALAQLRDNAPFEWLDCEALERRHSVGRGTLIVLDCVSEHFTYSVRRGWLEKFFRQELGPEFVDDNQVYTPPSIPQGRSAEAWATLQRRNAQVRCPFYEGLVAKEASSKYPIQLRSASEDFPFWVKHRWRF